MQQHFPAHHGDIPRAGKMPLLIQTAGVGKVGGGHTQRGGAGVHRVHKSRLAACHKLRHRHGGIVGAGNADRLEHLLQGQLLPRLQPDLAAAHMVGVFADRDNIC